MELKLLAKDVSPVFFAILKKKFVHRNIAVLHEELNKNAVK